MENEQSFTRRQLYDLVWSTPLRDIIKKFIISSAELKDICYKLKVPLPGPGHWQQVKFNKAVIPPLKRDYEGEKAISLLLKSEESVTIERPPRKKKHLVPRLLKDPDPLIIELESDLKARKPSGDYSYHRGVIECGSDVLDVKISPKSIQRALIILNEIIKRLKKMGHHVEVERKTYAIIHNQKIRLSLREKMNRVKVTDRHSDYKLIPTGRLSLQCGGFYYAKKQWSDGKEKRLESKIDEILNWLLAEGLRLKIQAELYARDIELEEKMEAIQEAKREREGEELKKFKQLLEDSERWRRVNLLKEYYQSLKNNGDDEKYLEWVKNKIDWFDPSVNLDDDLMRRVNKANLTLEDEKDSFF